MNIEISPETEAQLADEARRLGISVDALLTRFISKHMGPTRAAAPATFPLWHLGGTNGLHRRDIYDDAC